MNGSVEEMFDYSWFKVGADTFNDPKIKIIEAEDDSDTIICIWFKSLCLARIVNDSGYLYINGETPYTLKTLAIEFNRPLDKVKAAIKVLRKLQMIEFTEDKFYRVTNWTKYQNVDALEKQRAETSRRVAKHRAKKKLEKKNPDDNNGENNSEPNEEDINEINGTNNSNGKDNDNLENDENSERKNCEVAIEDDENIHDNRSNNKSEVNNNVTCNGDNSQCNSNVTKENIITENICNGSVTDNNVTVTDKIKRETKNQNKTEKKKESECNNSDNSLNESCVRIVNYYESITGIVGTLNIGTLKLSIDMHGEKYVKLAIQKAIECGKTNITYINGILKNWKREGYPSEKEEVKDNGGKRNNKGNTADKNEFAGFKPKKPKHLTEEQRKKIEADLI